MYLENYEQRKEFQIKSELISISVISFSIENDFLFISGNTYINNKIFIFDLKTLKSKGQAAIEVP
jgi:hypothetical protein